MAEKLPATDFEGQSRNLSLAARWSQPATLALFFCGLFLLAVGGGLFFFKTSTSNDDIKIISASPSQTGQGGDIVVHVDGAVAKPGVYRLGSGARVVEAIAAAGGLSREAERKNINLAAKVSDGQKIYVPAVGESASQSVGGSGSQIAGVSEGLININSASEAQLDTLAGVGPVTVQKIIASRPYSSLEELLSRKVVSSSVFEKIKDKITVY